jgi:hypothetical protein
MEAERKRKKHSSEPNFPRNEDFKISFKISSKLFQNFFKISSKFHSNFFKIPSKFLQNSQAAAPKSQRQQQKIADEFLVKTRR